MPDVTSILALVAATALLAAIPGPNVALIAAVSMRHGLRAGLATVLGTTLGVAVQLCLLVAGLGGLLALAGEALSWIRWAGVVYLLWLGVRTWRQPVEAGDAPPVPQALRRRILRGAAIALVNPKTLLFNAAFLPQFVSGGAPAAPQLVLLATVFLSVLAFGDCLWAVAAHRAVRLFTRFQHLRNRLSGGLLAAAGLGLALACKPS